MAAPAPGATSCPTPRIFYKLKQEVKDEDSKSPKKKAKKEEVEEEKYRWWEDENLKITKRGERRWDTLAHNGPIFPDPYVPHNIPIYYAGKEIKLTPHEEEIMTDFASIKHLGYFTKELFRNNFWKVFRTELDKRPGGAAAHGITKLELVNFDKISDHIEAKREQIKNMDKEEKKAKKEAYARFKRDFEYCLWDGRLEKLSGCVVEPPGLFRGRGEHPKQGMWKKRVFPEDVTINVGENDVVPEPPAGHKWGAVVHEHNATWLCCWLDELTNNKKYIQLGTASTIKGMTDREKFNKARRLHGMIKEVRNHYRSQWTHKDKYQRQLGVCMYFIDKLALRVGNEKDAEEEAETIGCCSLQVDHCKPVAETNEGGEKMLRFDFLGKDSVPYKNDVWVDPLVWDAVSEFRRGKQGTHDLFDLVISSNVNEALQEIMPELTAKVFRTYNASLTLEEELYRDKSEKELSTIMTTWSNVDKKAYFTKANFRVAELCNHQKGVGKSHTATVQKLDFNQQYTDDMIDRLKECQKIEKKSGFEAARKFFIESEKELHENWLSEHGTEEEREKYDAWWEKAMTKKTKPSKPRVKKEKKEIGSDDDAPLVANKKSAKKKKDMKPKNIKAEVSSDDDAPVWKQLAASKKRTTSPAKKRVKKEPSSDDDDDALLSVKKKTSPKKASKPSPKMSPKKAKTSPKKASPKTSPKKAAKKAPPKKAAPKKGGKKK